MFGQLQVLGSLGGSGVTQVEDGLQSDGFQWGQGPNFYEPAVEGPCIMPWLDCARVIWEKLGASRGAGMMVIGAWWGSNGGSAMSCGDGDWTPRRWPLVSSSFAKTTGVVVWVAAQLELGGASSPR